MKKKTIGFSKKLLLNKIQITALTGQQNVMGGEDSEMSQVKCTSVPPVIDSMRCSDSQIDCTATNRTCFTRTVMCFPYPMTLTKCQ